MLINKILNFKLKIILVFMLMGFCFQSFSLTKNPTETLEIATETFNSTQNTLVIPIKRANNLIIIEANINGQTGNFILDTGAPGLVLNETYFRDYKNESTRQEAYGVNGPVVSFTTTVKQFEINAISYQNIKADIVDLSSIENTRGIKILGLLGTQLFNKYAIMVDLFRNVLFIHQVDKKGNILEPNIKYKNPYLKTPILLFNNVILMKVKIAEKNFWFAFDTAAETNLMDYQQPKAVLELLNPINRFTLNGVGNENLEVLYTRVKEIQIATRIFTNNRFLVTNLAKMEKGFDVTIDGMLGYDFFTRGAFKINFVKKEFEMYIYDLEGEQNDQ